MPAKVMLNIYDMAAQNAYTYWCGLGVFHAGVEVYGIEWAYGGHEFDYSGVFATNPRDAPGQVVFRESVCMGETNLTHTEVERLVQQLGQDFKGNKYHLLQRNCNHFANDFCRHLVGREVPPWVNRLASLAVMVHCLLPTAWVPSLESPTGLSLRPAGGEHPESQALLMDGRHHELLDESAADRKDYFQERLRSMSHCTGPTSTSSPPSPSSFMSPPHSGGILSS